jgi:hypothetical protein
MFSHFNKSRLLVRFLLFVIFKCFQYFKVFLICGLGCSLELYGFNMVLKFVVYTILYFVFWCCIFLFSMWDLGIPYYICHQFLIFFFFSFSFLKTFFEYILFFFYICFFVSPYLYNVAIAFQHCFMVVSFLSFGFFPSTPSFFLTFFPFFSIFFSSLSM